MRSRRPHRTQHAIPHRGAKARIGLHGHLGSGNLGNDATFEALLAHLRSTRADARIDAMCSGPEEVEERYGVAARQIQWLHGDPAGEGWRTLLPVRMCRVGWGALVDTWRTIRWVRGHDVVIVPGMGSLETTLPVRPWELPYALFLVSVAGRLTRTRVAFVAVGASPMRPGVTRWLLVTAAGLAHYRSFRDEYSRARMGELGVDVGHDRVFPDLVFGLESPPTPKLAPRSSVGIGVIGFRDGRPRTDRIGEWSGYHRLVTDFALWLVDGGRSVRLLIGDGDDRAAADAVLAEVRASRPDLDPQTICFEPAATLDELARQIAEVDTVVASRFHNVVCAAMAAKPTIALGYARKHEVLMADLGAGEYALDVREASLTDLVVTFERLQAVRTEMSATLAQHAARLAASVLAQFDDVDALTDATFQRQRR